MDRDDDGTPLCLRCLSSVSPLDHFCPACGETTGQLTPYLPYLNIPFFASIFGIMWRRLFDRSTGWGTRALFLFLILLGAPELLLVVPLEGARRLARLGRKGAGSEGA